jgi:hypothetical protein
LVISPLRAEGLSFRHLLDIARRHTDRQQAIFLRNVSLGLHLPLLTCSPNCTTSYLTCLYPFHNSPPVLITMPLLTPLHFRSYMWRKILASQFLWGNRRCRSNISTIRHSNIRASRPYLTSDVWKNSLQSKWGDFEKKKMFCDDFLAELVIKRRTVRQGIASLRSNLKGRTTLGESRLARRCRVFPAT